MAEASRQMHTSSVASVSKRKSKSKAAARTRTQPAPESQPAPKSTLGVLSSRLGSLFGLRSSSSPPSPEPSRLAHRRAQREPRSAADIASAASAQAAQRELDRLKDPRLRRSPKERAVRRRKDEERALHAGVKLPQAQAWAAGEQSSAQSTQSDAVLEAQSEWGPDRLAPSTASGLQESSPHAQASSSTQSTSERPRFVLPHQQPDTVARARLNYASQEPERKAWTGTSRFQSRTMILEDEAAEQARLIHEDETGPLSRSDRREEDALLQEVGSLSGTENNVHKVKPLREMNVPVLAHGLDRVLFNPGVYWLRDPRSGIYNFDPQLREVLDVDLFDYSALSPYITSSKDEDLLRLTRDNGSLFCGSTSSMTSMMSQCYFLLSAWKQPDLSGFSSAFKLLPSGFGAGARLPASITLNYNDGVYAIDADKEASGEAENSNYVLTSLGKSLEKMLTSTPEEYRRYMRVNSHEIGEEERNAKEAYHYAKSDLIMMRSQLDCSDERLPRKTFDLKTRAVVAVRQDRANWVESSGYQIRRSHGVLESFEREYYDMIRSAFLKYGLQARIGHMDGILVAYHNTATMFGFQYIPLEEMNQRVYGSDEMAEQSFRLVVGLVERILKAATELYPEQTLKMTFETADHQTSVMTVYIEPARLSSSAPRGLAGDRDLVQLDVSVDRYLNGKLVTGPVDFSAVAGRSVDPASDDELARRERDALTPLSFDVRYRLSARTDLAPETVRAHLASTRARQAALSALLLPNVDAINERERFRESQLAANPQALRQYLLDRQSGAAMGMPMAPGQLAPGSASSSSSTGAGAGDKQPKRGANTHKDTPAAAAAATEDPTQDRLLRWRKVREAQTMRMRELSRLGAADRAARERVDELRVYERRD